MAAILRSFAILVALSFFAVIALSAIFPARSTFLIEAKTDRFEFVVGPGAALNLPLRGVDVIANNEIRMKCASGHIELGPGASLVFAIDLVPYMTIRAPQVASGQKPPATFHSEAQGAARLSGHASVVPDMDSTCLAGTDAGARFGLIPIDGFGALGPDVPDHNRRVAPLRNSGVIEVFTQGLACHFRVTCSIFSVKGSTTRIPVASALRPVVFPAWSVFSPGTHRTSDGVENAAMQGLAVAFEDGYEVSVSSSAHALLITSSGSDPDTRFLQVTLLEKAMSEPILSILLSLVPLLVMSHSILSRGGPGPRQAVRHTARLIRRRGSGLFSRAKRKP